jgi:hypothetical protein
MGYLRLRPCSACSAPLLLTTLGDQFRQALIEHLHALGAAGLDRVHLRSLALADKFADRRVPIAIRAPRCGRRRSSS